MKLFGWSPGEVRFLSRNRRPMDLFLSELRAMAAQDLSGQAAVSVSQMAELCQLSRSRFYDLIEAGVFPKPVQAPSSKRPIYDRALMEKCLAVRRTGIALNGQLVLFNRKPRRATRAKPSPIANGQGHAELVEALKGLGLTTTSDAVGAALAKLFLTGHQHVEPGDLIRKVFLHLQAPKK